MVASYLQDDLAAELEKIFENTRLQNPRGELVPVNVYKQELPIPPPTQPPEEDYDPELIEADEGLSDLENQEDPFPYAIVRIREGEIKKIDGDQAVEVLIIFGVIDRDLSNQGYKGVLNLIQLVYERFSKNAILSAKYECVMPIEWALQDEPSFPYFIGGMTLTFLTHPIRREDPYA